MVAGDDIYRPVFQARAQRCYMVRRPQRRIDLGRRIVTVYGFIGQSEMVRRCFRGNLHAPSFCLPDNLHGAFGADMGNVQRRSRVLRQHNIAGNGYIFGDRRPSRYSENRGDSAFMHVAPVHQSLIFGMGNHQTIKHGRIFQSRFEQIGAGYMVSVIRNRHSSGQLHIANLRQFLSFQPFGQSADYTDAHDAFPAGPLTQPFHQDGAVNRRPGIRHAGDHCESAGCSSLSTGNNIFLGLQARVPQVNMHIDQARSDNLTGAIHQLGIGCGQVFSHSGNSSVLNQNIRYRIHF